MTGPNAQRWMPRIELGILAVGISLRVARFIEPRPLWIDEALIALNVMTRAPLEFLRPLDGAQMSPIAFLLVEWITSRVAGAGEHALRFISLVAGVAALMAFARLSRRLLDRPAAIAATAFAAVSPLLVYYSAEVKSYAFDWLGVVLMMHATLTLIERDSRRAWWTWGAVAAFSAVFSTPAPFYVAGSACALLAAPSIRSARGALLRIAAASTPAALLFLGQWFAMYDNGETASYMQRYWIDAFLQPSIPGILIQAAQRTAELWSATLFATESTSALSIPVLAAMAVSLAGVAAIVRRSPEHAVMVFMPSLLVAGASMFRLWPLTPRLLLFVVPVVALTLAQGIATLAGLLPRSARGTTVAMASTAVVSLMAATFPQTWDGGGRFARIADGIEYVVRHASPDATVYVSADLWPACVYYLTWHPDRARLRSDPDKPGCHVGGGKTILGVWPDFGTLRGPHDGGPQILRQGWVDREGTRVLETRTGDLWMIIHNREIRSALLPWIESRGARRIDASEAKTVLAVGYRFSP